MSHASYKTCTHLSPECPLWATTYGYIPNLPASIVFVIVFASCCLLQIFLGIRYKTYPYMIAAVIGTFGEAVGYGGRIIMHGNPWSTPGFEMQICCLVLAPSFLAACIYLTFKHITKYCGPQYSRLRPKLYTWCFIGGDFGSIILQAIGGGVAAAGGHEHPKVAEVGDHIIVAGITFQVVTMMVAAVFMAEFYWRVQNRKPFSKNNSSIQSSEDAGREKDAGNSQSMDVAVASAAGGPGADKKFKIFCFAIGAAFLTIFTRCIYRIPEMSGGWGGPIMRKQTLFYILDGMMVAIASTLFTVFHPAFFFPPMKKGWEA